jgi:hypothetical protein
MMYKANVGDFPLQDYPCKYWWVRYAVACTYLSEQFQKIWEPRLAELRKKYNFDGFCSQGVFNLKETLGSEKLLKLMGERKIWVYHNKRQVEVKNHDSELWRILDQYLREQAEISWMDCPYEEGQQSKCPFYEKEEFYADVSLEELRQRKGYELC